MHNREFFKNIAKLMLGTAFGKVVAFIAIPIITRLYNPSDFGILASFTSLVTILAGISTFRYCVALPLPRVDKTAYYLLNGCIAILLINTISLYILLIFQGDNIMKLMGMEEIENYVLLIPISVGLLGFYEVLVNFFIRKRNYSLIAKVTLFQSIFGNLVKILLGLIFNGPLGLITGQLLSQFGGGIIYIKVEYKNIIKSFSLYRIKRILACYISFPIFRLPSQACLLLSTNMPILYFSSFYGTSSTGQLGLALMTIGLPIGLIGNSVSKAYYGEIANLGVNKNKEIFSLSCQLLKKLVVISIIPFFTLFFFSELIYSIVFGSEWIIAGKYSAILCIYLVFNLISSPFVNILNILNLNGIFLWVNITRLLLLLAVFYLSYYLEYSEYVTLYNYSLVLSFHYVFVAILCFWKLNELKKHRT
ncbi:hypothetical protein BCS95_15095 [Vibrio breoganii]|uniref:lipopolysaccharide biosynthesis protein n=1 Tax=Vibrio breoganii TaxID=553239 RepID=UPI000C858908|nr:oligosaccharide flippase family protein [Vibrio breoganii]PMP00971.1 hypothetical protein BCS95_15095 [Vibrio breoganii]